MFIPIGTDNPLGRRPTVNYCIIVLNIVIFIATQRYLSPNVNPAEHARFQQFMLTPELPRLYQFITYAFLHGSWMHLLGNMLFLYIFGNNVNDKLGHLGYLLLYLAGGVFSGVGHCLTSQAHVLGASGAVAAITGAYMVLFPKTYVHILYVIFFIGTTDIPALYFILFKLVIFDNLLAPHMAGSNNIAYSAHLAGYAFGIVIPMALLALKLLGHSHFDLWAVAQRWQRRQQHRAAVNNSHELHSGRKKVKTRVVESTTPNDPHTEQIMQLRTDITSAANSSDLAAAADIYLRLVEIDSEQVLPEQQHLDIANKLMHTGRHATAAGAYETFISHYQRYPFIEQVQLMLGLLYSRYLDQQAPARKHLQAALDRLTDPAQRRMCQEELDQLA